MKCSRFAEWVLVQVFLEKMGFDSRWVQCMMACISSVHYRVLLNQQPRELITQQDSDNVILRIYSLCTEALITNIKKEAKTNQ